jgi:dTDP-glucose 4,6-dehydratase
VDLKNKNILVTGADGFIGSHLVNQLIETCSSVTAFTCYNSFNSWGWIDYLDKSKIKNMKIISGDVRDSNGIFESMKNIDVVFHLAALIAIPFSYNSPESYIDTNIKGTLNILQSANKLSTEKVLVTSTSEVYGSAIYTPIDEHHPYQGQSPYSASKIGADRLAESFYKSFGTPVSIVRPFNTYGPHQSARAIIPTIISQIINSKESIKIGSIDPVRDFVYVEDTAKGFIKIAESNNTDGEEINIATGKGISIGQLFNEILNIFNEKHIIEIEKKRIRPEESEVNKLIGCNKKLINITGWKPETSLKTGLNNTINWMKNNMQFYKSDIYNI